MRLVISLCSIVLPVGIAVAHPSPQMAHYLLSLHHTPLMLLILVAIAILLRQGIKAYRG
jgi:hypothetical protein